MSGTNQPEAGQEVTSSLEPHPALRNHLILDYIFKRCTFSDLKTFRLVDKLWYKATHGVWKKYAVVRMSEDTQMTGLLNLIKTGKEYDSGQLYVNFSFKKMMTCLSTTTFWDVCGSKVKYLELSDHVFSSPDNFRELIVNSCPNLETLRLAAVRVDGAQNITEGFEEGGTFNVTKYPV